jgi:hypothetical protein
MRLSSLYTESVSTGGVAGWARTSFFGREKIRPKKHKFLTQTKRQFQSGGPQPPYEDKPRNKPYLWRRAKVNAVQ